MKSASGCAAEPGRAWPRPTASKSAPMLVRKKVRSTGRGLILLLLRRADEQLIGKAACRGGRSPGEGGGTVERLVGDGDGAIASAAMALAVARGRRRDRFGRGLGIEFDDVPPVEAPNSLFTFGGRDDGSALESQSVGVDEAIASAAQRLIDRQTRAAGSRRALCCWRRHWSMRAARMTI